MTSAAETALIVAASTAAGVMNALAGGGTILTYPALVFLGLSPVTANATSSVALWPGAVASFLGYRDEVRAHWSWLRVLWLPSLAGGACGALLLLMTPADRFGRIAPFLILAATLLFVVQGIVERRAAALPDGARAPNRVAAACLLQLAVAVYGGYFGAGIGILMLAILGFVGVANIHAANGMKNFLGLTINGAGGAYFIARGAVDWPTALTMMAGAAAGGYVGARLARRIGRARARAAVVVIGLAVVAALLFQRG